MTVETQGKLFFLSPGFSGVRTTFFRPCCNKFLTDRDSRTKLKNTLSGKMTIRDVRTKSKFRIGQDFLTECLVRPMDKIRTDDLWFSPDFSFPDRIPRTDRVPQTALDFSNSDKMLTFLASPFYFKCQQCGCMNISINDDASNSSSSV